MMAGIEDAASTSDTTESSSTVFLYTWTVIWLYKNTKFINVIVNKPERMGNWLRIWE